MLSGKMRCRLIRYLLLVIVLSVAALPAGESAAVLGSVLPDHITMTWTGEPQTTQTITWRTSTAVSAGQVQFALADGRGLVKASLAAARTELLVTNQGSMHIHSVTLTGLRPGTSYRYRVGDGTYWSEDREFRTAPLVTTPFKFLIFGDSQSIDYGVWCTTLQQAAAANRDAVFMTNVGDLVDVGQDCRQWNAWFDAAKGVIDTIPVMPVTGNHESYTPQGHFSRPELFTAQFKLPGNGPESLRGQVYSFDYGDVHFVVLDSQAGEQRHFVPDMLARQQTWLEQDLAQTAKRWKVIFLHRPLYSNAPHGNAHIRKAFGPIFDAHHVDIVFTGHDHVYARTYPLLDGKIVDKPIQGIVYVATGRSGTKAYGDTRTANKWNAFFYNPLSEPVYLTVGVTHAALAVKAFKQNGSLIDEWTVQKP